MLRGQRRRAVLGRRKLPPAPAPARLLFATHNQQIGPKQSSSVPAGKTRFVGRSAHVVSPLSAMKRLRIGFNLWSLDDSAPYEVTIAGGYTLSDVFLEYGGASVRLGFSGANGRTIDGAAYMYFTDDILPSAFGAAEFAAGATIWVRYQGDTTAGQVLPSGALVGSASGITVPSGASFRLYDPANHIEQVSATGAMATPTGASTHPAGAFGLVNAVIGEFASPNTPATMLHGDSIFSFGQGPRTLGWDAAAANLSTQSYPGLLCAKIGAGLKGYAAAHAYRDQLFAHANCAIVEDGTNDISAYNQTFAQITTNMQAMFGAMRTAGVRQILRPRLLTNVFPGIGISALSYDGGTGKVTATVDSTAGLVNGASYRVSVVGGSNWGSAGGAAGTPITVLSGTQVTYTPVGTPSGTPTVNSAQVTYLHDDFRSKAAMRPKSGWGAGELRDQLHTQFAAWAGDGTVSGVPDSLTPVADAGDNHYWKTDGTGGTASGTSNLMVSDGVHPSSNGLNLSAAPTKAALAALVTGGVSFV
ncbi:hypothetical protein [Sphingomonas profundi]|uniref:hypothetical protein n=1 Tax=Alterirhizorhabdus profundi TaxID=2681549 RepID=UPI0012E75E3F|nr:hypothetical protein [Sphingomonas profundi]